MFLSSWIQQFKRRLSGGSRSRLVRRSEHLENRTLLAVNAALVGTELSLFVDEGDDVTVSNDTATGNVLVNVNGSPGTGIPTISSSALSGLRIIAGSDDNVIDVSSLTAVEFPTLTTGTIVIEAGDGNDTITGSPDFSEVIRGQDGADTINGDDGNNTLDGGDGDDTITGGAGLDSIDAGDGDDIVDGGDGGDNIVAGDGTDSVTGGLGNDTVDAGQGDDTVDGGDGDDSINGMAGADSIVGGVGNDTVLGGSEDDTITGGDGDDSIDGQGGSDLLTGDAGNDTLFGGQQGDSIQGGDGNDVLNGMGGNDTLLGRAGDDTIYGGAGNDIAFGDSDDPNAMETGNDRIRGNSGDDTLNGSQGADFLDGNSGNDLVRATFPTELFIAPPPPPLPPPPPPPMSNFLIQDLLPATPTTMGSDLGTTTTLTFGTGDGSLAVTVDALGDPASTVFDPLGPMFGAVDTLLFANLELGAGLGVNRSPIAGTNVSNLTGTATEARSTFDSNGLNWELVQTVGPLNNGGGVLIGALLTQTYTITNPTNAPITFELVRYTDHHMFRYPGVSNDGGGRIFDSLGNDVYLESTNTIMPNVEVAFAGISGIGGTPDPGDRYWLADLFIVDEDQSPLPNLIEGDTDGDDLVDVPTTDNRVALRNPFTIQPGTSELYTAHTAFGNIIPLATNMPPTAVNDSATIVGSVPVTLDLVSNDIDTDGVLDFGTILIATAPTNGTVAVLGDGRVTYTPNPGFAGTDSFTYTIADDDGEVSNAATVTVTLIDDAAPDTLFGSTGRDTLIGSSLGDFINGGNGADSILGQGGDDSILGGALDDTIEGGDGDDTIDGQSGDDVIRSGSGNDTINWGGTGNGVDIVEETSGSQSIVVTGSGAANTLTIDSVDGVLRVSEGSTSITASLSTAEVSVLGGNGNDTITLNDISDVRPTSLVIDGQNGDDTIGAMGATFGPSVVELNGGAGNDTINGSADGDSINGGDGDDLLNGGADGDIIDGGDGNDVISGEDGNDTLMGNVGDDTINGNDNDDSVTGGFGDDLLLGDAGNDTVMGGFGNDNLNGSSGDDLLDGNQGNDTVTGGTGADRLDGGTGNDVIRGQGGADQIKGGDGDDNIEGNAGDDTIDAGDGNDTVSGGNGRDIITGGNGHDAVNGNGGRDTLLGGDGNDALLGGGSADFLYGQQGTDTLRGNSGNDRFNSGEGGEPPKDLQPGEQDDNNLVISTAVLDALAALTGF